MLIGRGETERGMEMMREARDIYDSLGLEFRRDRVEQLEEWRSGGGH